MSLRSYGLAAAGTEGASFLDIPVGGRPAALGASYSALATDAYAPVWNPAGLGFLNDTEVAGMHLSYLETINYEFASFVHPLAPGRSLGVSVQYFSPGSVNSTDLNGNSLGSFTGHYGAYSLAYGQTLNDKLSVGVTGKVINAQIDDVTANAFAFDAATLYKASDRLQLAAVLANVGTKLKFIDQSDSLPDALRIGAAYKALTNLNLTGEGVFAFRGLASAHMGVEYLPSPFVALRAGFRTDTTNNLSALAGFSTGIGLHYWGQEFDYTWVPLGDLGSTQYFSLVLHFGPQKENSKNLQTHAKAEKMDNKDLQSIDISGATL